jgi:hypothetical protein
MRRSFPGVSGDSLNMEPHEFENSKGNNLYPESEHVNSESF